MDVRYVLGIDYGTESGRVVLVDVSDGQEIAWDVTPYPHGVMDVELSGTGVKLGAEWALQHPQDYVEVLRKSVPEVLEISGAQPEQIIGIGVDFTSSTILPVDQDGNPLCYSEEFRCEPHAYVKLWKHHAAQHEANLINELAASRAESFLGRYGGKVSSEWMTAKALQVLRERPDIYDAADRFIEAADWIVFVMTGALKRNSGCAGYKSLWHRREGYPSTEFYRNLDPRFTSFAEVKLRGDIVTLGESAGLLTEEAAGMMGLCPGIAVAPGIIDAHAAVPGVGATTSGDMVLSMGTSLCHLLLSDQEIQVEGICGIVEDGIIPGLYAYEAGQPAVGDMFGWYVKQGIPAYVESQAEQAGVSVHEWLEARAAKLLPGENGLIALDWWNGNRSNLVNSELSGMIIGLTLQTRPEEIYRALLESAAFGTRHIIEAFEAVGVEVKDLYACGGLTQKNKLLMQLYADITGREIKIAASAQTPALGAAMFGAVAAGSSRGGYGTIQEAAKHMVHLQEQRYSPITAHQAMYDELYKEYRQLHDYFGRDSNYVMPRLKQLQKKAVTTS
ncbi:ribulokinase [Paenibacillus motobuensis]|uniref:ribulokinase n=1 Tax=Paenibacillus TaxID=44249 RepID=UPI00203DB2FE|nr:MULTISPECIES: ribulokinase [Paenibacillus]MCM3039179.1 ribulokinase [Paenibacillus lutimineralis]MCM3646283.1 ribulokinase [Paenibacillus motobuensis]